MIDVLVLGQRFTATRIVRTLNSGADDVRARFVSPGQYWRLLRPWPSHGRTVIIRIGYRMGAPTPRGRLFDAYWALIRRAMPRALTCHYWLGSDVMRTIDDLEAGRLRRGAILAARDELHLAVAPWLATELQSVGLPATTALLPAPVTIPPTAPPLPDQFSVMSYLPTRRFDFYGGGLILELARRLPQVRFDVVASDGDTVSDPPGNVHWHGWVADMADRYANATVIVRVPRHDGFGNTVIEGLLHARHVIYTQEVPFVRTVRPVTVEALATEVAGMFEAFTKGRLELNNAGREYAIEAFDPIKLGDDLRALLRANV